MEDKKRKYEEEKLYSMGELYKEYINQYEERNKKRKENGELIRNGKPCNKKEAEHFLKDVASAVGVYKEFTNPDFFQNLFFDIKGFEQFENGKETLERKNKPGNPNWNRYKFTEDEKNDFIELLDYKEDEEVKKCRGFKKDNLKADPEVRKTIEQIFINYLENYDNYFNKAMFYNCFEHHLWEFHENIYPVNEMVNNFFDFMDTQRKVIKDLLPEFLEKVIIEYDKGIYWLMRESLNIISDLIFEFTMNFKKGYESTHEMFEKNKENEKDIDKEGREKYAEMIYKGLNSEKFKKERILLEKLKNKKFNYKGHSDKINEYREAELDMIKEFGEVILKYHEYEKQFPEIKTRGMDIHMLLGRKLKIESMGEIFRLLKEKKIDFEKYMVEKISNRMIEEGEEVQEYLQSHNC